MGDATISRVRRAIWHVWAAQATAAGGADLRCLRFATSTASCCHQQREASAAAPQTHQIAPRSRWSHGINHLESRTVELPDLLERLLATPGPSGQERAAAAVWREAAAPVGDVSSDALGNSWARVPGVADGPSLALVGHIDEIAVVVTNLGDDGLAAVRPGSGWNPNV